MLERRRNRKTALGKIVGKYCKVFWKLLEAVGKSWEVFWECNKVLESETKELEVVRC